MDTIQSWVFVTTDSDGYEVVFDSFETFSAALKDEFEKLKADAFNDHDRTFIAKMRVFLRSKT